MFLFCYYADYAKAQMGSVSAITYNAYWYRYSVDQRQFIEWIIRRAQKPFITTGGNIFPLSMETFAKVCGDFFLEF